MHLHDVPPSLIDLLQSWGRSVFGALKAEHGAIYRADMSEGEDKRKTKADFAANLVPAWEHVSGDANGYGWECCDQDTLALWEQLQAAVVG